jgi:hypothetical protein
MQVLSRLTRAAVGVSDYNARRDQELGRTLGLRPVTVESDHMLMVLAVIAAADAVRAAGEALPMACAGGEEHRHDPEEDAFCRLHDQLAAFDRVRAELGS